ncbi:MAG: AAA family ATPase [Myxococcales bacterium]|nr:AAA family ATPase [Myxococcales bacterium]
MEISQVRLENFRCFAQQSFEFGAGFNLIVGDNGTGKTAILDALAVGLRPLLASIDPSLTMGQRDEADFVRRVRHDFDGFPDIQPQYPWRVHMAVRRDGQSASWTLERARPPGATAEDGATEVDFGLELGSEVRQGQPVMLPLLRHFGVHRGRNTAKLEENVHEYSNRLIPYRACLDAGADSRRLELWMRWQTGVTAQRGRPSVQLGAVEQAVLRCVGARRFYYDLVNSELRLEFADDSVLPLRMLSEGYRSIIVMVADIAWRAVTLNPHLGADAPAQTAGAVLIDELDLHLHPKWQRRVIADLRAAFPKVQFIATSHSPFVIQALEDGRLIELSEPRGACWKRRSIEDIAEEIQGVENPQRSERFLQMVATAEEFYRRTNELADADDEHAARLRRELDELMERFSEDPAYVAMLKLERVAAEARRG